MSNTKDNLTDLVSNLPPAPPSNTPAPAPGQVIGQGGQIITLGQQSK